MISISVLYLIITILQGSDYMSPFIELKNDRSEKIHYDFPEYPIYIRHAFLSECPNYSAPSHWHDDIEFISILSGEMSYNVNGEIITLKSGEGIFVNSRQMHFGFSPSYKECEFICVLLHPMFICLTPGMERNYVIPVTRNQDLAYIRFTDGIEWNKTIIEGINQIYGERQSAASALKTQSIFTWIWALIYENMPKASHAETSQNIDLFTLKNMIGFIQEYYNEKITLKQIAKAGNIGQSKCCKLFDSYLNQTPNTYLIVYRLNKSAELLRNTDMTVTEISYAVGFSGSSYYAEAFRKWAACSPTEYRRSCNEL